MKPLFFSGVAIALLALTPGPHGPGSPNLFAADKIDFNLPQTPAKPAPAWLKLIDQGSNDPRLKGYRTPEGVKVEVVAEAPVVVNPVGMTFAADGTPYVLEWRPDAGSDFPEVHETFTYKDGSKRKVATMKKRVKDVVKVLADSTGKGVYDRGEVILEDELPSSILLRDGWIYLSSRGTVRRYKQSKPAPGAPYDVKEVIAQGFCGFHHHQVSGMSIGSDGWLYITAGDDDNFVEGSDGSRATVLRTGGVFRCRPDGSKMTVFAQGFRNPYRDVAFDAAGNMFHVDNDNEDGSKFTGCRLMYIAEGNDFGWRLRTGARCCAPDPVRGAVYGELPGKVPPLAKTGRGAPAGLMICNSTCFPEKYRGLLFYPDVLRKSVRAYRVERDGAGFAIAEEFEFLKSDDPLFRPCQMLAGPDGAMYVVDWRTDSGGAGRLWGDGKNGRIYRITWAGVGDEAALPRRGMDSWAKVVRLEDETLVKALVGEDAGDRAAAMTELRKRGDKNRPALLKLLDDADQPDYARFAALGVLYSFWNADVQMECEDLLGKAGTELRRQAVEALGWNTKPGDRDVMASLLRALADPEEAVRRSAALGLARVGGEAAADSLVNTIAFDDGKDVYLSDGYARAIESLGKTGIDRLLALADSGVPKDLDRVVDVFTGLRTRAAADALPALLKNPHLSINQRARLIASWSNYLLDPPVSLEPCLDYLTANPEAAEVKLAGLTVLSASAALKGEKGVAWLASMLDEPNGDIRLGALKAVEETRLVRVSTKVLTLLLDPARPLREREVAVKALRVLNDRSGLAQLRDLISTEVPPGGQPLRLEVFRTLVALDPAAGALLARKLLDNPDEPLRPEAVQALGGTIEGARLVGKLFLDGKLPRELLPRVTEALDKHAGKEAALDRLRADVVKSGLLVSNSPEEIARIRKLVAEKGNAQRGRAVYLNSKTVACTSCHRLEGIGGNVGPDLTRIWETLSLEKVLESLLEPSKEIKEGFQSYQATTNRGQVVTGLKVTENNDELVLRDAHGLDVRLLKKDLEEVSAAKKSLMPDNVIGQLTYEQLIDLVAFLRDRKAQESLRGLVLEYHVVGPFAPDLKTEQAPESKPDLKASYPGAKPGQTLTWQSFQAEPTGLLNLAALLKPEPGTAYALAHVHSAKAQQVQLLLGSGGPVRVWLNGKLVHEQTLPRSAKPDEDRVEASLQEGWNLILVKLVSGEKQHGLYLRLQGEGLRVARSPVEDRIPGMK